MLNRKLILRLCVAVIGGALLLFTASTVMKKIHNAPESLVGKPSLSEVKAAVSTSDVFLLNENGKFLVTGTLNSKLDKTVFVRLKITVYSKKDPFEMEDSIELPANTSTIFNVESQEKYHKFDYFKVEVVDVI